MKKFFLIAIIPALLPFAGKCQITLSGKVTDTENFTPLAGAHIFIENTFITTVSDKNGNFQITNLKKGKNTLKISYIGYTTYNKEFNINKDTLIIAGLKKTTILSDEIVVTALRADDKTPVTYTTITAKELKNYNLGQDIPLMLEMTPSAVSTSDAGTGVGYTGFRIRGTDMTGINVTINDVPLNDPESHQVYWVDLPDLASSVNSIQIQRGVGTSTNGGAAFGGSINIRTNNPSPLPYGTVSSSYGSFNTLKNTISAGTGLINNKWAFDGRFSRITSDGYVDRAFSDLTSYYFGGGYFGKKDILQFKAWTGEEHTYQAWYGIPKDLLYTNRTYNPYDYKNQTDNYRQDHYHLAWSHEFANRWSLNTALHYTKGKGYYEEYKKDRAFKDYTLDNLVIGNDTITSTNLVQRRWLDNDFTGFTFSIIQPDIHKLQLTIGGAANNYAGRHFGKVIWAQYSSNGDIDHEWYRGTGHKTDGSLYLKAKWEALHNLLFYCDLQGRTILYEITGFDNDLRDIAQNHDFTFFNPKAGGVYIINSKQKVYGSFAISNREPSRSTYVDANPSGPAPKHETLYNYEAGYEFRNTNIYAGLNIYHMQYKDQLVLTGEINDIGDPVMTNVAKSYRQGFECMWGIKILKSLTLAGNISLSKNKILNFTEHVDDWDNWGNQISKYLGTTDISFSPSVIASNTLTWEPVKNLNASFISKYVGKQYIDNTSSSERSLDPYFVNNINVNWNLSTKLFKQFALKLQVNNIFDNLYESNAWVYRYYYEGKEGTDAGYFPQAGRNFLAGVEIGF